MLLTLLTLIVMGALMLPPGAVRFVCRFAVLYGFGLVVSETVVLPATRALVRLMLGVVL